MNKTGIIYKVTSPSGKVYIGKTVSSFRTRRNRHLREAKNCIYDTKFHRAIRKYGDLLIWEIEESDVSLEILNEREIFYIQQYDSFLGGYNETLGGDGMLGRKLTTQHKKKISDANTGINHPMFGKHHSDETKKIISESLSGENNPNFGGFSESHKNKLINRLKTNHPWVNKKHSQETKEKMSLARKLYWESRRNKNGQ